MTLLEGMYIEALMHMIYRLDCCSRYVRVETKGSAGLRTHKPNFKARNTGEKRWGVMGEGHMDTWPHSVEGSRIRKVRIINPETQCVDRPYQKIDPM